MIFKVTTDVFSDLSDNYQLHGHKPYIQSTSTSSIDQQTHDQLLGHAQITKEEQLCQELEAPIY